MSALKLSMVPALCSWTTLNRGLFWERAVLHWNHARVSTVQGDDWNLLPWNFSWHKLICLHIGGFRVLESWGVLSGICTTTVIFLFYSSVAPLTSVRILKIHPGETKIKFFLEWWWENLRHQVNERGVCLVWSRDSRLRSGETERRNLDPAGRMETLKCRAQGTWETQRKGKETLTPEKSMPEKPWHEEALAYAWVGHVGGEEGRSSAMAECARISERGEGNKQALLHGRERNLRQIPCWVQACDTLGFKMFINQCQEQVCQQKQYAQNRNWKPHYHPGKNTFLNAACLLHEAEYIWKYPLICIQIAT